MKEGGTVKLSERQSMILRMLNSRGGVSVDQLCAFTETSKPTVKAEIQALNKALDSQGISIRIETGGTVVVNCPQKLPGLLAALECEKSPDSDGLIKLYLLLKDDFVSMQEIADSLHMSRSFVEKRIADFRRGEEFPVVSDRRSGVIFGGSPYERVALFADQMMPYIQGVDFVSELARLEDEGVPASEGISRKRSQAAVTFADALRHDINESLTDEAYRQLLIYAAFLLMDDAPGCDDVPAISAGVEAEPLRSFDLAGPLVSLATLPDALPYRRRVEVAAAKARVSFTESQLRFLTGVMASVRKSRKLDMDAVSRDMDAFIIDILTEIADSLGVDLRRDRALRQGLSLHIYTTVIRRNSLAADFDVREGQELKYRYPLGFEMATHAARAIAEKYGYTPTEEEIVYLTMHFQVAIERLTAESRKIATAVVCHYGQAAANLIAAKLSRLFPALDVQGVFSMQEYLASEDRFELVLATELVPPCDAEVIYVSPALRGNEIDCVRMFVSNQASGDMILKRIREADVVEFPEGITRDQALELLVDHLESTGAVLPGFLESAVQRENISSTSLTCIAVPHGSPELVSESSLAIGRSKDGIDWGGTTVNCVFLLTCPTWVLDEKGTLFSTFYRGLASLDHRSEVDELKKIPAELLRQRLISAMSSKREGRWT